MFQPRQLSCTPRTHYPSTIQNLTSRIHSIPQHRRRPQQLCRLCRHTTTTTTTKHQASPPPHNKIPHINRDATQHSATATTATRQRGVVRRSWCWRSWVDLNFELQIEIFQLRAGASCLSMTLCRESSSSSLLESSSSSSLES